VSGSDVKGAWTSTYFRNCLATPAGMAVKCYKFPDSSFLDISENELTDKDNNKLVIILSCTACTMIFTIGKTAPALKIGIQQFARAPHFYQTAARTIITRATRYTLNTGAKIPALGFGTFQDADAQVDGVALALKKGFRLIDTARVYDVEQQVGKGIKKSGIPREEVFVGTKLWCNDFHPDDVERALEDSLRDLDTPYVDLLMMHYPCSFARGSERFPRDSEGRMIRGETTYIDTWKAMEKLVTTGKVKAIGVSNFSKGEIETLLREGSVVSESP
jgi:hypothetical protein